MVGTEDTLGGGLTHPKILIVDDELMVRKILLRMLETEPYTLFDASTVDEARALFDEHCPIDVLITDLGLSSANSGYQLAQELVARLPSMRVIIISGYLQPSMSDLDSGTYGSLGKPFTSADLKRLLRAALGT